MSETKWTPGPWHAVNDDFIEAENGTLVIEQINNNLCDVDDDEITANANLIAAAPELYEAGDRLAHFARSAVSCDCPESTAYLQSLINNLRAALRRARGETA